MGFSGMLASHHSEDYIFLTKSDETEDEQKKKLAAMLLQFQLQNTRL